MVSVHARLLEVLGEGLGLPVEAVRNVCDCWGHGPVHTEIIRCGWGKEVASKVSVLSAVIKIIVGQFLS